MAKKRIPIPKAVAAKVLFSSDRTCCVCRVSGRRVQIHHIDDDPSNNDISNLAVLCFECHGDTQTAGGFGRQLDAEQVGLYRDDWHRIIAGRRAASYREALEEIDSESNRIKYLASLTERLRDSGDYVTLADVYDNMGNGELRDKYIDLALAEDSPDWLVVHLRGMQGRVDLIPEDVANRYLDLQADYGQWEQRARTFVKLGNYVEAAHDYVKSILESLEEGRVFGAAFYLKEIFKKGLVDHLFEAALQGFVDSGDLWWQVRCMQELGWRSELNDLLLVHEEEIRESGDLLLIAYLFAAQGNQDAADSTFIEYKAAPKIYGPTGDVSIIWDHGDEDEVGDGPATEANDDEER